jgi:hypothetical protein
MIVNEWRLESEENMIISIIRRDLGDENTFAGNPVVVTRVLGSFILSLTFDCDTPASCVGLNAVNLNFFCIAAIISHAIRAFTSMKPIVKNCSFVIGGL